MATSTRSKNYVREWRLIRRMTQGALAQAAGLSRPTVVMVERCQTNATEETLAAIATVLGVKPAQLMKDPFARFEQK